MMTPALLLLCFATADPVANPDEAALEEIMAGPDEAGHEEIMADSVGDAKAQESGAAATSTAGVTTEVTSSSKRPYRDSKVELGVSTRAVGYIKDYELMYNPNTVMGITFKPHWWLSDKLHVSGRFDMLTEFTQSDVTTGNFFASDLSLSAGYDIYDIPVVDINVSGGARVTIPTSLLSQGRTMVLGTALELSLSRAFKLLGGVQVGYSFEFAKDWHEYTTADGGAKLVGSNCVIGTDCAGIDIGSGSRNISWTATNTLSVSVKVNDWISGAVAGGVAVGQLYGLEERSDLESNPVDDPDNAQYYALSMANVTFFPQNVISGSVGILSFHPQLMPDSSRRSLFLNRYTRISVGLSVDIDDAMQSLEIL